MLTSDTRPDFRPLRLPLGLIFVGLCGGLAVGLALGGTNAAADVLAISETVGALWLRALQMTIIPLVAALLVTGIARMVVAAQAGAMARRSLAMFYAVLGGGTLLAACAVPPLLDLFPIPQGAADALVAAPGEAPQVPGMGDFVLSLVSPNIIAAAAQDAMLPLVIFFALFGAAVAGLPAGQRETLVGLFTALGNAMLVVIGWILALAPLGVFALAIGLAMRAGGGAFYVLGHYVLLVSALGFAVLLAAYPLAIVAGGKGVRAFARAMLPAQAVAISTQSSLASLPAMLAACRQLGVRETSADFVLPLAVAIFRATSPAMNLAVALYIAKLSGVPLTPGTIAAGAAVALVTTAGSVSLPGTISFVASIGPIALVMGVPIGPLALLVAVEMLPDIMRTVGNVTMDVAVASVVDRAEEEVA